MLQHIEWRREPYPAGRERSQPCRRIVAEFYEYEQRAGEYRVAEHRSRGARWRSGLPSSRDLQSHGRACGHPKSGQYEVFIVKGPVNGRSPENTAFCTKNIAIESGREVSALRQSQPDTR